MDSPDSPQVNSRSIFSKLQQQLRGTVPSCDNKCSIFSVGFPSSLPRKWRCIIIGPGKTKVGYLQDSTVAD